MIILMAEVRQDQALELIATAPMLGGVKDAVIDFKKVEGYTTFLAEYAFTDGDIVVHFFPPREAYIFHNDRHRLSEESLLLWQRKFPQVLSPTAEEFFQATAPVLKAAYTAEMFSWWFKAAGFANRLEPEAYLLRFFDRLDAALDAVGFAF